MLWKHSPAARVFPQLFRVLPNFHECFYNSIETRRTCFLFLLENTVTKKRKQLVNFDYKNINKNYNKILECDWLSVALIIAFIGQFTRNAWCYWTVYASCLVLLDRLRVMPGVIGQFTRQAWCYWTVYASFARAVI